MALWPANRSDGLAFNPYRYTGNNALFGYTPKAGSRFNPHINATWSRQSAIPQGYSAGGAYALAIRAGGLGGKGTLGLAGGASLLSLATLSGAGNLALAGAAALSLGVTMSGTGTMALSGSSGLSLVIGLSGTGNLSLGGNAGLSLAVPLSGAGAMSLSGAANLKGALSLSGSWGGAAPLSPEGLADAVWSSPAAAHNSFGTMGALLNASGAGGDPWSVTLEGTYNAADLMRIIATATAGKLSGAGTGTETFRSIDDSRDGIIATVDAVGNRLAITIDPS